MRTIESFKDIADPVFELMGWAWLPAAAVALLALAAVVQKFTHPGSVTNEPALLAIVAGALFACFAAAKFWAYG